MTLRALKVQARKGLRFFRQQPAVARIDRMAADNQRLVNYQRYARWYEGIIARGQITTGVPDHAKRLKYNFNKPIVNIPAGFLASAPLVWDIRGEDGKTNEELTSQAKEVWDRSGAERAFLEAVIWTGIYGDCCLRVGRDRTDPASLPVIEFLLPDACYPLFGGTNHNKLIALEIASVQIEGEEESYTRHEYYDQDGCEIFHDERRVDAFSYPDMPVVWVRNNRPPGWIYGQSDLEGIVDLVDEYDHVARKQTQIVDYYASPRIVAEGVRKSDLILDVDTIIYAPAGSKVYFLEWSGSGPAVEDQLTRIRNAIAEISQVPAVAFGQMDKGHSTISGIGLKILYAPLINKVERKQANWGPALERAMWLALTAMGATLPIDRVNCLWQDLTPADMKAIVEQETLAVEKGIKSKRSAMRAIGIEDPDAEIELIREEAELLTPPEVAQGMELAERDADRADKATLQEARNASRAE